MHFNDRGTAFEKTSVGTQCQIQDVKTHSKAHPYQRGRCAYMFDDIGSHGVGENEKFIQRSVLKGSVS